MVTRTCEVCSKSFDWQRFGTNHVGKYCSRACATEGVNGPRRIPLVTIPCLNCGQPFTYNPSHQPPKYKGQPRKYCSIKCSRVHGAARGPRNAMWKPQADLVCEICGKEYQVKQSKVGRSRTCSPQCRQTLVVLTMPRVSSIEHKLFAALASLGHTPIAQYAVLWYVVDLAFPDQMIAIECDGDYWHSGDKQKAKDRRKTSFLKNRGWTLFRFTETDINASPEACARQVVEVISQGNPPHLDPSA